MADYTKNSRSIINNFLWQELVDAEILDPDEYRLDDFTKTIVPIVPVQQLPELNNLIGSNPYILYDYEIESYGDAWWICEERMLYTIVGTSISKISEITEFMVDLFRRKDISGKEVQSYNPDEDIVKFYTVCLESVSSPEPFQDEGGRMAGTVEITYKYSKILNSNGRFI
jgi:hypothetical protein